MHRACALLMIFLTGSVLQAEPKDLTLLERIERSREISIESNRASASGKESKRNPEIESQFTGKAFHGGGQFAEGNKSGEMATFRYDQKVGSEEYKTQKSFFGIKNPWFGKEVHEIREAPLLSGEGFRTDKDFAAKEVDTRAVPEMDRDAFAEKGDVPTRTYRGNGEAEGTVTQFGEQLRREMDIEEVRELLNKNH